MSQKSEHPCISCGACCAYFRVQFYWREAEKDHEHKVPRELTVDLDDFKRVMKGTNTKHPVACVALKGKIGKRATCSIYENRPTPCRAFTASFEDGRHHKRCDEARAAHGLRPLRPDDYPFPVEVIPQFEPAPDDPYQLGQ
jgi:uncharacterized protein